MSDKICKFCNHDNKYILSEDEVCKLFHFDVACSRDHFVVAPKRHVKTIDELSMDEYLEVMRVGKVISDKLLASNSKIEKISIIELVDRGQHFHVHFIPRYENEEAELIEYIFGEKYNFSWKDSQEIYTWNSDNVKRIRKEIQNK